MNTLAKILTAALMFFWLFVGVCIGQTNPSTVLLGELLAVVLVLFTIAYFGMIGDASWTKQDQPPSETPEKPASDDDQSGIPFQL